jgi:hypothetical protein
MPTSERKLLFRFDVPKKHGTGEACILVYQTAGGFSLVATAADDGDAEVFLTREELAQFRQRLSEVIT